MKIAVVVTARPSWAKLQTLCEALAACPDVELQIIACASALLERYGHVAAVIERQFPIAARVWSVLEGETLLTGARETGIAMTELASVYERLRPDVVCVMADRREVLAAAAAAKYQHIPLAHLQGGERTGSIDDRVRDSITALADYHFTCTERAKYRVVSLTGAYDRVWQTGCGSIDLAQRALREPPVTREELGGAGAPLMGRPCGVVLQHAVTNEADAAHAQMWATLEALPQSLQWIVLWPGQDAGAAGISKAIREYQAQDGTLHTVRNLPPSRFLRLLTQARVLVGNSSAGIREGSFLGVPVVNIGTRQWGRERARNVVDVPHEAGAIREAICAQAARVVYPRSGLYGTGDSGAQVARVLREVVCGAGVCADSRASGQ